MATRTYEPGPRTKGEESTYLYIHTDTYKRKVHEYKCVSLEKCIISGS